ncbi:hypothetical protein [Azospirillum sp. sgz302134]
MDLKTGLIEYNEEKHPRVGKVVRDICPTAPGAKDWNPSAFSPKTGIVYIPHTWVPPSPAYGGGGQCGGSPLSLEALAQTFGLR